MALSRRNSRSKQLKKLQLVWEYQFNPRGSRHPKTRYSPLYDGPPWRPRSGNFATECKHIEHAVAQRWSEYQFCRWPFGIFQGTKPVWLLLEPGYRARAGKLNFPTDNWVKTTINGLGRPFGTSYPNRKLTVSRVGWHRHATPF